MSQARTHAPVAEIQTIWNNSNRQLLHARAAANCISKHSIDPFSFVHARIRAARAANSLANSSHVSVGAGDAGPMPA